MFSYVEESLKEVLGRDKPALGEGDVNLAVAINLLI